MEPLPIHLHDKVTTNGRSKPHIIYRRSVTLDKKQDLHVAREKREIRTCGTEGSDLCLKNNFFLLKLLVVLIDFNENYV